MRVILFLLIVLAVGKIGMQSYIRQQSAKDTIINAYREENGFTHSFRIDGGTRPRTNSEKTCSR